MGKDTKIAEFDHTFNPWWGCAKIAIGCQNCYAKAFAHRLRWEVWGKNKCRRFFGPNHWAAPIRWNRNAGKSDRSCYVLCGSMCDVFEIHSQQSYEQVFQRPEREKLWALIDQTPQLTWMLLTKRPENIETLLPHQWRRENNGKIPANVWFGYSASNQADFDTGWPTMESFGYFSYAKLFLSLEPLLGYINLDSWLTDEVDCGDEHNFERGTKGIDWVRIGGETGRGARRMALDWVTYVLQKCERDGTPAYLSQLGTIQARILGLSDTKGAKVNEWPAQLRVQQLPCTEPQS
jgi:protein gp37